MIYKTMFPEIMYPFSPDIIINRKYIIKAIENFFYSSSHWGLSSIWSRDIICLHILLHRIFFLCSKICKQIMSLDQMRDPNILSNAHERGNSDSLTSEFHSRCKNVKKLVSYQLNLLIALKF